MTEKSAVSYPPLSDEDLARYGGPPELEYLPLVSMANELIAARALAKRGPFTTAALDLDAALVRERAMAERLDASTAEVQRLRAQLVRLRESRLVQEHEPGMGHSGDREVWLARASDGTDDVVERARAMQTELGQTRQQLQSERIQHDAAAKSSALEIAKLKHDLELARADREQAEQDAEAGATLIARVERQQTNIERINDLTEELTAARDRIKALAEHNREMHESVAVALGRFPDQLTAGTPVGWKDLVADIERMHARAENIRAEEIEHHRQVCASLGRTGADANVGWTVLYSAIERVVMERQGTTEAVKRCTDRLAKIADACGVGTAVETPWIENISDLIVAAIERQGADLRETKTNADAAREALWAANAKYDELSRKITEALGMR